MQLTATPDKSVRGASAVRRSTLPVVVLAATLLVAWKMPRVAAADAGFRALLTSMVPIWMVLGALLIVRRGRRLWPSAPVLVLLGLAAVTVEVAVFRGISESMFTLRTALLETVQWGTFVVIGAVLFWTAGDDDRQEAGKLLVIVLGGYVITNVGLALLGVINPLQFTSSGEAQLASLIGFSRDRMVFPLTDGINSFGDVAGAAVLGGLLLCFTARATTIWRVAGLITATAGLAAAVGTDSRGALMASLAITVGLSLVPKRMFFLIAAAALLLALTFPVLALQFSETVDLGSPFQSLSRGTQDLATMNGRLNVWNSALELIVSGDPGLFGYGAYGHDVSGASLSYRAQFNVPSDSSITLHNTLLQYVIDTGYVGALVMVTLVVVALWRQLRLVSTTASASRILLALLIYLLLVGVTESAATIYHSETMAVAILLLMASAPSSSMLGGTSGMIQDFRARRWRGRPPRGNGHDQAITHQRTPWRQS